jgi:NTP pyrophosphatase (non-canonical NTP hydrolase)
MSDIKKITKKIKKFVEDRDWKKFHNHKDMALSIVLESAELLEHFQWKSTIKDINEHVKDKKEEISDEIADIAIYLLELADNLEVDLLNAIEKKLKKCD